MYRSLKTLGLCAAALLIVAQSGSGSAEAPELPSPVKSEAIFSYHEYMVPMRDGTKLQTVVLRPLWLKGRKLPMLVKRTPYGVPEQAWQTIPMEQAELAKDGYIWVFQNLRGRFKSEGVFNVSTKIDVTNPNAVDDATDSYDTIDWLIKHVPDNNGRAALYGISYSGLTAGMALTRPHPALRAVSSQAAPVDQFMNDDLHHNGALRLSYAFEYAVLEQSEKFSNAPFKFDNYDTYDWYLKLGPVSNGSRYLNKDLQLWTDILSHPDYDEYWKNQVWTRSITAARVPTLTVAGFWDQEDPWGPWQLYHAAERRDPRNLNVIVAGPWTHGSWSRDPKGATIGEIPLGGHETSAEFRSQIEAPFFAYWLHDKGKRPDWGARIFEAGSNMWRNYASWPPKEAKPTHLYFHGDGSLSFDPPTARERTTTRTYVSDPANPVPYRQRPITSTFDTVGWEHWETRDQRFVDHRPDVLSYQSAPLDHDIRVAGEVAASLFASTSGTDADFVVKLIDVYPEDGPDEALRGYQFPMAMEVQRGRFLDGYDHPRALTPDRPREWRISLRDRDYVFKKGHRIMVQVQSSWFPIIDRNPQTFVPDIPRAREQDFQKATQTIYSSARMASSIIVPVIAGQQ
ncbi:MULTISPECIES: CocE/NonD family hydrolase [unclassified Sphingomonas]|uniref:CocE/NonD family hydrolase n=1 Tax=unclassified Sphingomonas TaxID=196159 RepID=UPI0006F3F450|nr:MULTISPECIES: CocE/NonD family hydrolase [unclassified Sphingomonas]KQX26006.1 X-Pro dipeptidyl-peptidase [Sphingomonas sp. Root1294]KQY69072.1 X-Pro dipeptidyl-peptidase [Sphingomonas sp. Root50]KRB89326.1 X-Pro dipeptidyl-peptidase [Sphingomonas sp. Root720]